MSASATKSQLAVGIALPVLEPPGSAHLISENASATEPAGLLAVFIADDGAQVTTSESARSAHPADNDQG